MNILVFVKEVPDTESPLKLVDGRIDFEGIKFLAGPYDEYAVEEALLIREREGGGKITLLCYGPERAGRTLNSELAKGADELVLCDEYLPEADPLAVGELLAKMAEGIGYHLILAGWKGTDMDNSSSAIIAADKLGIPHVSYAVKIEIAADLGSATVHRAVEGSVDVCQVPLPAVITCQKGLNEPRYAKLTGIMKAKKKPHHVKKLADYGLSAGGMVAKTEVEYKGFEMPPAKEAGIILEGDDRKRVLDLIEHLREDEKVL